MIPPLKAVEKLPGVPANIGLHLGTVNVIATLNFVRCVAIKFYLPAWVIGFATGG